MGKCILNKDGSHGFVRWFVCHWILIDLFSEIFRIRFSKVQMSLYLAGSSIPRAGINPRDSGLKGLSL